MRLWKRKHKNEETSKWQESIACMIVNGYRAVQYRWVRLMERIVGRLTIHAQKVGCVALLLGGAMYCTTIIYNGIKNKDSYPIKVDAINPGKHLGKTGEDYIRNHQALPYTDSQHLKHFMDYLDSLQQSPTGRHRYDSIARHRPGLLDSISILRKIYFDQ